MAGVVVAVPANAQSIFGGEVGAGRVRRMSTKVVVREVRTRVDVGSEGGAGSCVLRARWGRSW